MEAQPPPPLRDVTNTTTPTNEPPQYPYSMIMRRELGPRFGLADFDVNRKQLGQGMFGACGRVCPAQPHPTHPPTQFSPRRSPRPALPPPVTATAYSYPVLHHHPLPLLQARCTRRATASRGVPW